MPDAPVQNAAPTPIDLDKVNADLAGKSSEDVIRWASETFGDGLVMTTSFGVQAAVMLHLVTRVVPEIPVIFIDTGFHFPETYRFADELTQRLGLNLKAYQPRESAAWFVARHGELWDKGATDEERLANLTRYDEMRKVEPMQRALSELHATAWLAGLRKDQTDHRALLDKVAQQGSQHKVHPILTWTTRDVHNYLKTHDLPYHPLHEKGYASVGDWHSTFPIGEGEEERAGRFHGLKQECGIHLPTTPEESQSRDGSML